MAPPKVKLVYFPLRGRAELIRLILAAGGVAYEEELVTFAEWPKKKPSMVHYYSTRKWKHQTRRYILFSASATPLGYLPVLVWDGEEVTQSLTAARFCARKCGLAGGGSDAETARADAIAEHVVDLIMSEFEKEVHISKAGSDRHNNAR